MSELLFRPYEIPSASLGLDNPLPDLKRSMDAHASINIDKKTISEEESRYMGYARVKSILPYLIRDGYDRVKKPRAWQAAILRNDYIEATFLPELGGRLWSLVDRQTGRELLHKNPVFQPCNLALRNAWFSGGVEWNVGIIGHTPFTVEPLFTEEVRLDDGTPVLRMFQYERVRHLVYRIEALLPEDSRQLIVHISVTNAGNDDTACYWWSNIAVDEREDVRVLVPATRAFHYGYGRMLSKVPVPRHDGMDASRTMTLPQAMDFFFDIDAGQRCWIAALDRDGYGLCQSSTDTLRGRKLFVWGMGKGGRNWQTFLSEPGSQYIEIQAGLARTQLEHIPMAGGASYSWTEAYGAVKAPPEAVHGEDWSAATQAVETALEGALPRDRLDAWDRLLTAQLSGRQGAMRQMGDGWGALEAKLCGGSFQTGGVHFPEASMGAAEKEWLALLTQGALPEKEPLDLPTGYQVNGRWMKRLAASIDSGKGDHWYANYHLGVMHAYHGEPEKAIAAFERSLSQKRTPWALRCIAALAISRGDKENAAKLMLEAVSMMPQRQLSLEALQALFDASCFAEVEQVSATLPAEIRSLGRLKTLRADALIELGRLDEAEEILLSSIELTDVREGEVKLTDIWFKLCERKGVSPEDNPPPAHLDFRMR